MIKHTELETDPFIAALRIEMLKFALLHISDHHFAEEAVQEALTSAWINRQQFKGKSAFKTWVFTILKNKIIDIFRKESHTVNISAWLDEDERTMDQLFDQKGFWHKEQRPVAWPDPYQEVENTDFWLIFEVCLNHLPAKQAQVFMLRESLDLSSEDICEQLALSLSNLNVLMYRARLKLRECLENKWLLQEDCSC